MNCWWTEEKKNYTINKLHTIKWNFRSDKWEFYLWFSPCFRVYVIVVPISQTWRERVVVSLGGMFIFPTFSLLYKVLRKSSHHIPTRTQRLVHYAIPFTRKLIRVTYFPIHIQFQRWFNFEVRVDLTVYQ